VLCLCAAFLKVHTLPKTAGPEPIRGEIGAPRPRVEEPFNPKKFWEAKDTEGSNQP